MIPPRFHHLSLLVGDTARALTFYHDLLGLPLLERPELGFAGAWLDLGVGQLHLLELADAPVGHDGHVGRDAHLALLVDDLEAVAVSLQRNGIETTPSRSGRRALFCRDPDGNGIELVASDS